MNGRLTIIIKKVFPFPDFWQTELTNPGNTKIKKGKTLLLFAFPKSPLNKLDFKGSKPIFEQNFQEFNRKQN